MPPIAYSIADAAKAAGVGRTLIYQEIKAGRLRVRKCGKRTIIPADDLRAWLNKLPTNTKAAA